MVTGSWLMAQGSWLMPQGSWSIKNWRGVPQPLCPRAKPLIIDELMNYSIIYYKYYDFRKYFGELITKFH